jgi:hypothetical protein
MPEELPDETVGAPEVTQPTVDWQKRYTDTHAEFNRLNEQFRRFESDPDAVVEFIREKHPDLIAAEVEDTPEEPDYEPNGPVQDPRFDTLEPTVQQLVTWQAEQQYKADLKEVAGDRSLSDRAKRTIKSWTAEGGNTRQALEAAVKEWFETEEELRGPQRKPAPTPPSPGKATEVDPNASKDPELRRRARRARIAAQVEAGMQQT